MAEPQVKWWGWGDPEKRFAMEARPKLLPFLRNHFNLPEGAMVLPVPKLDDFTMPASRLSPQHMEFLAGLLGTNGVSSSRLDRLTHAVGKSYHDLIRLRYRQELPFPDAVAWPQQESQIIELLRWAEAQKVALVPFGGGTSVVGGVEAVAGKRHSAVLSLDLKKLNRIIALTAESLLVEAEAGLLGPDLESYLEERGFTLGHFPESFTYSTLGGWVATRSAGQFSNRYGKIEDMVESVRLITPRGIIETPATPASATGPDIKQVVVGSEGVLGIISRVRLRIRPLAQKKFYRAYVFPTFVDGVRLVRQLVTNGARPTLVRLLDGGETDLALAVAKWPKTPWLKSLADMLLGRMAARGFLAHERSLFLFGAEGNKIEVAAEQRYLKIARASARAFVLGTQPVKMWYRHRYDNPYLRDELIDRGLLIDTLETACEWHCLLPLYHTVREKIIRCLRELGLPGLVMAHISHVYPNGSSLYFIILAQPVLGKELAQWHEIKRVASEAILCAGGALSHHHGIGLDHAPWLEQQVGTLAATLLQSYKSIVDPCSIMNPGKLIANVEERSRP
jgi:alkyldihydroxyacetonephosphate synthase